MDTSTVKSLLWILSGISTIVVLLGDAKSGAYAAGFDSKDLENRTLLPNSETTQASATVTTPSVQNSQLKDSATTATVTKKANMEVSSTEQTESVRYVHPHSVLASDYDAEEITLGLSSSRVLEEEEEEEESDAADLTRRNDSTTSREASLDGGEQHAQDINTMDAPSSSSSSSSSSSNSQHDAEASNKLAAASHDTFIYYTYNNLLQSTTPPSTSTPSPSSIATSTSIPSSSSSSSSSTSPSSSGPSFAADDLSSPEHQESPFEGDHGDRTSLFDEDDVDNDDDDDDYYTDVDDSYEGDGDDDDMMRNSTDTAVLGKQEKEKEKKKRVRGEGPSDVNVVMSSTTSQPIGEYFLNAGEEHAAYMDRNYGNPPARNLDHRDWYYTDSADDDETYEGKDFSYNYTDDDDDADDDDYNDDDDDDDDGDDDVDDGSNEDYMNDDEEMHVGSKPRGTNMVDIVEEHEDEEEGHGETGNGYLSPAGMDMHLGSMQQVHIEEKHMIPEAYRGNSFLRENSMSLLVIYTWLGVVAVLLLISLIVFKQRQKIANFFWDNRTGYRRNRTAPTMRSATEEGHQLLSSQAQLPV